MATTSDRAAQGLTDTWTRTELLRQRGYPPEVIAGNNHFHIHPDPGLVQQHTEPVPTEPLEVEAAVEPSGPTCRQCGGPLTGAQTAWCSQRCKRTFYETRRRNTAKRSRPAKASTAAGLQSAPGISQACDSDRLAELVARLAGAGLTVRLEVDGLELVIRA